MGLALSAADGEQSAGRRKSAQTVDWVSQKTNELRPTSFSANICLPVYYYIFNISACDIFPADREGILRRDIIWRLAMIDAKPHVLAWKE